MSGCGNRKKRKQIFAKMGVSPINGQKSECEYRQSTDKKASGCETEKANLRQSTDKKASGCETEKANLRQSTDTLAVSQLRSSLLSTTIHNHSQPLTKENEL